MTFQGCPGSRQMNFDAPIAEGNDNGTRPSQLRQWPVQLHLVSPQAPYFMKADVLLSADCVAYAVGDFHKDFLKGKSFAIACPKLDNSAEVYTEKLVSLIDDAKINTLTVAIMQVPCCSGLAHIAKAAMARAERKIPVKAIVVSLDGKILSEQWL